MNEPREIAETLEQGATLPRGEDERFTGYGVMGVPFSSGHLLKGFGKIGGRLLDAGRINLTGKLPNGQQFTAGPKKSWAVRSSRARVCGRDLGPTGPLSEQARLRDMFLPQKGLFFVGNAYMESFDPRRHHMDVSRNPETDGARVCYA